MTDSFNYVEPDPSPLLPLILPQAPLSPIKKSNNNRFYIFSGIILFVLLICSFLVFNSKYIVNVSLKSDKKENTVPTLAPISTPSSISVSPKNSAKEAYLKMKADQENFKTYDDYIAYYHKYGSKSERDFIDGVVKKLEPHATESGTIAYKENILGIYKATIPLSKDITSINELVSPNHAILTVSTNKPGVTGTIDLVLEDGVWKFDREQWTQATNHTPAK